MAKKIHNLAFFSNIYITSYVAFLLFFVLLLFGISAYLISQNQQIEVRVADSNTPIISDNKSSEEVNLAFRPFPTRTRPSTDQFQSTRLHTRTVVQPTTGEGNLVTEDAVVTNISTDGFLSEVLLTNGVTIPVKLSPQCTYRAVEKYTYSEDGAISGIVHKKVLEYASLAIAQGSRVRLTYKPESDAQSAVVVSHLLVY